MKTFRSSKNLAQHMQGVHEGIKKHICKFCKKAFFRTNDLKKHTQKSHDSIKSLQNDIIKHALLDVTKNIEKNISNSNFLNNSTNENEKIFKCESCIKQFDKKYSLKRHIRSVHEGIKDHKCHNCEKTFSRSSDVNRHIKNVHEEKKKKNIAASKSQQNNFTNNFFSKELETKSGLLQHAHRSQSFTSLMADLRQDINRVSSFSRCLNGTFP